MSPSARSSTNSAKKASSPCSPKPALASTPLCSPAASSTALHFFVSPQIMGSDAVPAFKGMAGPIRMAEVEVERYGNDLGLCSLLKDPWPATQV